jgi:hypothetical protein
VLYDDYLVDHAATPQEKITYLLYSLDSQAKGFFRWVLFSELDAKVEQSDPCWQDSERSPGLSHVFGFAARLLRAEPWYDCGAKDA